MCREGWSLGLLVRQLLPTDGTVVLLPRAQPVGLQAEGTQLASPCPCCLSVVSQSARVRGSHPASPPPQECGAATIGGPGWGSAGSRRRDDAQIPVKKSHGVSMSGAIALARADSLCHWRRLFLQLSAEMCAKLGGWCAGGTVCLACAGAPGARRRHEVREGGNAEAPRGRLPRRPALDGTDTPPRPSFQRFVSAH